MHLIRYIFFTLISIILTAILLVGTYLFVDNFLGTIVLFVGLISLFILFIFILIGLKNGKIKFLKLNSRLKLSFALSYLMITGMLLTVIWMFNFVINDELGELSATDKLNFMLTMDVNDKVVNEFTEDYLILKHHHITFKYHPNAEKKIHEIISRIDEITQLEREIFGHEITKTENLEVIVLPSFKEYRQMKPLASDREGGSYTRYNKRALIYLEREGFHDDESFLTGIFSHEYGHYLLDVFFAGNGMNFEDIPTWYQEGISEYISMQVTGNLRIPRNVDPELKFSNLQTSGEWNAAKKHSDVYFLAVKAIEYVVGSQSDTRILTDILLHQKETGSFEKSFEQLTGFKLATLNTAIYSVEEDLDKAFKAWRESDFETAEKLYEEITQQHPREFLAWHQYAMMLEMQKRWDEALSARRKVNSIDPQNAGGFLNTSYLLTVIDTKEAVDTAKTALELAKKESSENVYFYQKWLDEISQYHNLMNEERYTEAYQGISQSEQLSNTPTIMEDIKENRK